ncbi:adenylate kinase [Theileria orientalis]|uniref:Adenylate kinase isoenzyme 6 homolog n=1 Tax=Theileria orientalis TaxID=68886 RepID=A0A976M815_THEOR|nr:adenylate kinase [Theileria orientalis]
MSNKRIPNVLVLGTPGCGKTTLCLKVLEKLGEITEKDSSKKLNITHLNIADLISEKKLYSEWDKDLDCSVYDDDLLDQELQSFEFEKGGFLVEFHSSEFFEDGEFDRVYVLLTEIDVLRKRLEDRKYSENKIEENIQCEIFQTCLFDSYEVFDRDKVVKLASNTEEDLETNAQLLLDYFSTYNVLE